MEFLHGQVDGVKYLSGAVNKYSLTDTQLGVMLSMMMGNKPNLSNTVWAADNGCFATPHLYSDDKYLRFLEGQKPYQKTCLFATLPDVVGNAKATIDKSLAMLSRVKELGYPVAFVAQDGQERIVKFEYSQFDFLFIGGTTEWKLSFEAMLVAREATEAGCLIHMGRVNSFRRLVHAQMMGCYSVDGTFLAFGPDVNYERLKTWMAFIRYQSVMSL